MLDFRLNPSSLLLLTLLGAPLAAQSGAGLEIPLEIQERSANHQPAWPATLGLPLPQGLLAEALPLEFASGNTTLPAASAVLSRWPDGTVRWLRVDLLAPELHPAERLDGTLRARGENMGLEGDLFVAEAPNQPLIAGNDRLRLEESQTPGTLFRFDEASHSLLRAPVRQSLRTEAGDFVPLPTVGLQIERQNEIAIALKRVDDWALAVGEPPVFRVTTRLVLFRGSSAVRLQQSLDVLRGVHAMRSWGLTLPLDQPGNLTRAPFGNGRTASRRGDTEVRQTGLDSFTFQGKKRSGAFPGVVGTPGLQVGLRHFAELYPTTMRRQDDDLVVDFCPGSSAQPVVLEEGFGRTVELWLVAGDDDPQSLRALAGLLERPLRPHATGDWYRDAEVFAELAAPQPGDNALLEERMARSTDHMMRRRRGQAGKNFGFRHFGDFFDGAHTMAYAGSLQQEYDPGVVLIQQFLRTSDLDYLDPALDLAWHYADVNMTPAGGAFNHRATQHHVEAWIAGILAQDVERECRAWSGFDGTLVSALSWVESTWGQEPADTLSSWLDLERDRGLTEDELFARAFTMIGFHMVELYREELGSAPVTSLRDYAAALADVPRARARGYDDPDADFAGFFALYGGSWDDFPSFHVDSSPIPEKRHQSGHSLIQSVALAHLLSGEPRLRQRALAFGDHHCRELVPRSIATLVAERDRHEDGLYTRTVAWPLINLDTLVDLTCGMPTEQELHDRMLDTLRDCTATLLAIPLDRIRSSIHAGITLEGLSLQHRRHQDPAVADYIGQLARDWAARAYDWQQHAFRLEPEVGSEAYHGMSGLMLYGLAYAESLSPDEALWAVIEDAWDHLPEETGYAKAFAMLYRTAPRTLALMRSLAGAQP